MAHGQSQSVALVRARRDADSGRANIQPGSWISIYGRNPAAATTRRDGGTSNIPTHLGGQTATINRKPAILGFTSSGQLNLPAPDGK